MTSAFARLGGYSYREDTDDDLLAMRSTDSSRFRLLPRVRRISASTQCTSEPPRCCLAKPTPRSATRWRGPRQPHCRALGRVLESVADTSACGLPRRSGNGLAGGDRDRNEILGSSSTTLDAATV